MRADVLYGRLCSRNIRAAHTTSAPQRRWRIAAGVQQGCATLAEK